MDNVNSYDDGWEKWSLPIGNGYMGVNVFGRKHREKLQITENSLCNPYAKGEGGLQSLNLKAYAKIPFVSPYLFEENDGLGKSQWSS